MEGMGGWNGGWNGIDKWKEWVDGWMEWVDKLVE